MIKNKLSFSYVTFAFDYQVFRSLNLAVKKSSKLKILKSMDLVLKKVKQLRHAVKSDLYLPCITKEPFNKGYKRMVCIL